MNPAPDHNQAPAEDRVRQFVHAFADGELDLDQTLEALGKMVGCDKTASEIDCQQKLRTAVSRVMTGPECKSNPTRCPELVKAEIAKMVRETAGEGVGTAPPASVSPVDDGGPGVLARLGRWAPLAAAASLVIVAGVVLLNALGGGAVHPFESSIVNASLADRFGQRHRVCSVDLAELYEHERFPEDVRALPATVATVLGDPAMTPMPLDLTMQGYRYAQAGRCNVPGEPAVHVIYHPIEGDAGQALSLWISLDRGELDRLEPGRLYLAHMPAGQPRMMVWRHEGMVYHLVGNALADVESAMETLWARGVTDSDPVWPFEVFGEPGRQGPGFPGARVAAVVGS